MTNKLNAVRGDAPDVCPWCHSYMTVLVPRKSSLKPVLVCTKAKCHYKERLKERDYFADDLDGWDWDIFHGDIGSK